MPMDLARHWIPQVLALLVLNGLAGCRYGVGRGGGGRLGVDEPSGMVVSPTHQGVYWVHGDSGTPAALFSVADDGKVTGRLDVQGAKNVDWEDMTLDDEGHLWIGDIGNNNSTRDDLRLYRVSEPSEVGPEMSAAVEVEIPFVYPDQEPRVRNWDAESLVFAKGALYLLTKHREDSRTVLYRFPSLEGTSDPVKLERIAEMDVGGANRSYGGMTTAADVSPDGKHLAILTYHALIVLSIPATGVDLLGETVAVIEFNQAETAQCEALTWLDNDTIRFSNEGGRLFKVDNVTSPRSKRFP